MPPLRTHGNREDLERPVAKGAPEGPGFTDQMEEDQRGLPQTLAGGQTRRRSKCCPQLGEVSTVLRNQLGGHEGRVASAKMPTSVCGRLN